MDQQPASRIKYGLRLFSSLLLMSILPALQAGSALMLPPLHQVSYSIEKYATQVGEMHSQLTTSSGKYTYTSTTSATGFASLFAKDDLLETSVLSKPANDEQQIYQQTFNSIQGRKNSKNQKITFRQNAQQQISISGSYKKRSYQLDTTAPVWGRHMLPLLMSSDLQQTPDHREGQYTITDRGRLHHYGYTFLKRENLHFSGELIPVMKFRLSREGSDRFSYVWLSEKHHYLPLKVEQYKDNELHLNMLLTNYRTI